MTWWFAEKNYLLIALENGRRWVATREVAFGEKRRKIDSFLVAKDNFNLADHVGGSFDMKDTLALRSVKSVFDHQAPMYESTRPEEIQKRAHDAGFSRKIVPGTWFCALPENSPALPVPMSWMLITSALHSSAHLVRKSGL